ncbi:MAG: hypothetical protein ACNS60_05590 [Candidatus Cyclobacteriaceae bacterium M2_1C_046]
MSISKILRGSKSSIQALCLTLLILFFAGGSLPQYHDFLNIDPVEMVENIESETSSENKESNEKEIDKFVDLFSFLSFTHKYKLPVLSQEYKFLPDLYANRITPPPESV